MSQTARQLAAMFLAAVLTFALCVGVALYQFRTRSEPRRELRDFLAKVQVGDSKTQVRKSFNSDNDQHLKMVEGAPDLWHVNTPFEFGSGNWNVWMKFEGDTLRSLRLRIADGMQHRPRDAAPPDEIAAGWLRNFPSE